MSKVEGRLQDAGLVGRIKKKGKKKPYLRLSNKMKRLKWAKDNRHRKTGTKMLWTDNSKFEVFASHTVEESLRDTEQMRR